MPIERIKDRIEFNGVDQLVDGIDDLNHLKKKKWKLLEKLASNSHYYLESTLLCTAIADV